MATGGLVSAVLQDSPAYEAGFEAGDTILSVDSHALHDIIDWRWYSAADEVILSYIDNDGDEGEIQLVRDEGEEWGFEFQEALFDGTRQCRNACMFCFMQQLPSDSRESLRLRDDDFRLSFLQGTFVTLTNISPEDEARIIEQHISPLRFSLHAVSPALRERIIGKHAAHGLAVAERLLAAGIQLHAQIVLMPHENDGEELCRTLQWAYERPGVLSVGIVPVGFTKHQTRFSESFTEPKAAQKVIELIAPFQERALKERNDAWVHASDEFYRNAYPTNLLDHLPPAQYYGDFNLFDDGIGIVRSYVDDFLSCPEEQQRTSRVLAESGYTVYFVSGYAQKAFFSPLLNESPCDGRIVPLYVQNDYFGGNVDVTGLLCACDIAPAIASVAKDAEGPCIAVIPSVVFNADCLTLDGMKLDDIAAQSTCPVHVVSCQASEFLPQIVEIVRSLKEDAHG